MNNLNSTTIGILDIRVKNIYSYTSFYHVCLLELSFCLSIYLYYNYPLHIFIVKDIFTDCMVKILKVKKSLINMFTFKIYLKNQSFLNFLKWI